MTQPDLPEKKLIQSAKSGDLEAFEKILLIYERPIYAYVFRLVGRREDAEDLTQETFVKIYKFFGTADPEKNFKAWIYKIATNTVYNWFKKKKNKTELFIIDDANNGFETIDPKSLYYNIVNSQDVERALARIKPEYRTVLLLFYWQDLDYKEIAEAMAMPINTIKTYLRRAKIALGEEVSREKVK